MNETGSQVRCRGPLTVSRPNPELVSSTDKVKVRSLVQSHSTRKSGMTTDQPFCPPLQGTLLLRWLWAALLSG